MDDKADRGGIDTHAEGGGGDDEVEGAREDGFEEGFAILELGLGLGLWMEEGFLDFLAVDRVEAGVVGGGGDGVRS